jgi:phage shock protein C
MPILHGPRRLYRIMSKKRIAGICAGFAYWLSIEVWLMRLMWIVLLLYGIGFVAYILFWIVLPKEETASPDFDAVTGD